MHIKTFVAELLIVTDFKNYAYILELVEYLKDLFLTEFAFHIIWI